MAKYTIPFQNMKFLEVEKDPLDHSRNKVLKLHCPSSNVFEKDSG